VLEAVKSGTARAAHVLETMRAMKPTRHAVVWMDHARAHVFDVDTRGTEPLTVRAPTHPIHRHPKGPTAEHNHPDDAHHFFREVARSLEGAERILVVGPSTAKLQFLRYASQHDRTLEPRIVGIETVDHPTDGQLVAHAKKYFEANDRME
jgi:stalled ribosome rescue protein Dom34